ncbi:MAG: hypothetical protein IJH91_08850 [Mogibacterium sp.]|nr:hypothetical protein [Mogibacterium sp.]
MAKKEVWQGNEALSESALRAGCRFFAGYPITPQTEITEYLAKRMPQLEGRVFLQGESELASINMVYGASAIGARAMTATSGQGLALMAEGLSQLSDAGVPAVVVDVMRAGPGNGGTESSQGDYSFVSGSLGHGGFKAFIFGPSTVQETADMVYDAFDIADKYRVVVAILIDGMLGHLIEAVELKPFRDMDSLPFRQWAEKNDPTGPKVHWCMGPNWEQHARDVAAMYESWSELAQVDEFMMDDAEYVVTAWGTCARCCKTAIRALRAEGYKVGMIRPKTIFPFPKQSFAALDEGKVKQIINFENAIPEQFLVDVKAALAEARKDIPIVSYTHGMGTCFTADEIEAKLREVVK